MGSFVIISKDGPLVDLFFGKILGLGLDLFGMRRVTLENPMKLVA